MCLGKITLIEIGARVFIMTHQYIKKTVPRPFKNASKPTPRRPLPPAQYESQGQDAPQGLSIPEGHGEP